MYISCIWCLCSFSAVGSSAKSMQKISGSNLVCTFCEPAPNRCERVYMRLYTSVREYIDIPWYILVHTRTDAYICIHITYSYVPVKKVFASFKQPTGRELARHVRRGKGLVRTQNLTWYVRTSTYSSIPIYSDMYCYLTRTDTYRPVLQVP